MNKAFLYEMLRTESVSGGEIPLQKKVAAYMREQGAEVETDLAGDVISSINSASPFRVLLCGHIDEIGFRVTHITDDGYLQVGKAGGIRLALAQGKRVTVLEMMPEIARDAMRTYRDGADRHWRITIVVVFTGCKCLEISAGRVIYQDSEGQRGELKADTVLLAVGMRSRRKEAETFRKCAPIFRKIGDCEKVGTVRLAVRTGWNVAYTL